MATEDSAPNAPFQLEQLRELIELMEKHDLTEINLKHGEQKWRLRRGPQEVPVQIAPIQQPVASPVSPVAPVPAAAAPDVSAEAPADNSLQITSPTVGTFYTAPTPDDPAFVTVGARVEPETIVCIVEAMKVFNQIPAEVNGTIAEVLVENGDAVEFGQPLFRVSPG